MQARHLAASLVTPDPTETDDNGGVANYSSADSADLLIGSREVMESCEKESEIITCSGGW